MATEFVLIERNDDRRQTRYSAKTPNCNVSLINFHSDSINSRVLQVQKDCDAGATSETALISLLLSYLVRDISLNEIETVAYGGITASDYRVRLALEASRSEAWLSKSNHGRKSRYEKTVPEVAEILRGSSVFEELTAVFEAFGYSLVVSSTEGVLVDRLNNIVDCQISACNMLESAYVPYSANVWFDVTSRE